MVAVHVQLEFSEAYWSAVTLTARLFRKIIWLFGTMATVWLLLLAISWARPRPDTDWQQMLTADNRLAVVFFIPIILVFILPLLSARKILSSERNKRGTAYRFSDAGIHVESHLAVADVKWGAILSVVETRTVFLLSPAPNVAHTVPLRCFANDSDLKAARELFRENISSAKLRHA